MTSKATDVDGYVAEAPVDRRAVMEKLRAFWRENLPGV